MRGKSLLVLVTAGLLLTSATGALSAVSMDRSLRVAVASDANAYLGYQADFSDNDGILANGTVTVTNQIGTSNLEVTVDVDGRTNATTLDPGEATTFSYENVTCGADVVASAEGDRVGIELTRTVDCA